MQWTRRDWLILAAVVILAALLRFYQLGVVPPGPQFDEAFNAIDAQQVLAGNRPLFLPANGGRESLYTYVQAAVAALLGLNIYTLRLVSALAGTLTVGALYVLVRRLFRWQSRILATTSALALTVSLWHVHFSHYGIRVILMPLLFTGVFGALWIGLGDGRRRARMTALVVAGILAGLSVWANPTGRFTPFIIVVYALYMLWQRQDRRRFGWDNPLVGAAIVGAVAFALFLPLGLEFWRHPEFFFGHASEVSVFADRVSGARSTLGTLFDHTVRVLGMFSFFGDPEWIHGIPARPVFDWLLGLPFYIGLIVWALRLAKRGPPRPEPDRDALVLMALWGAVMLLPSVLSDAPPNFSRTLPAIPAVMLAAGLGLTWLATWPRLRPWIGPVLAGVLLFASGCVTVYDYFVRFANAPDVYYAYDADKVEAVNWMAAQAQDNAVYLAPLWSEHATVNFLRGDVFRPLNTTETIVLPPPGKGAVYAFPSEQMDYAQDVAEIWGGTAELITNGNGQPLLAVARITAEQAADWPPDLAPEQTTAARFDDAPTLLGMRSAAGGHEVLLYWQAAATTLRDLTSLLQLLDSRGRVVGQQDRVPGDSYFRTPTWQPGERVIQRYTPAINDVCVGGSSVRVVAAWYEYLAGNLRRPRLDAPGDLAAAGELRLPFMPVTASAIQIPNPVDIPAGAALAVKGYHLDGTQEPGAPLLMDLYLAGEQAAATTPLTLTLSSPHGAMPAIELWSDRFAPDTVWHPGEVICRRAQVRLPADLPPGDYRLNLAAPDGSAPITALTVTPSTRLYELPPLDLPIDATFDSAIRLAAATVQREGDALTVTLGWQALRTPEMAYTAFVQLLGPDGALVAQSDAVPGAGNATTEWAPEEVVVDTHHLTLPQPLPGAPYMLVAGLYDPITGQRAAAVDNAGAAYPDQAVPLMTGELP